MTSAYLLVVCKASAVWPNEARYAYSKLTTYRKLQQGRKFVMMTFSLVGVWGFIYYKLRLANNYETLRFTQTLLKEVAELSQLPRRANFDCTSTDLCCR